MNVKYRMSFTTGGLFHRESLQLAMLFLEVRDWKVLRDRVLTQNLLQSRTLSTAKRIYQEIAARLQTLDLNELDLLVHGTLQEQCCLLWISICRRYAFIADFAVEVLRERYISLKSDLQCEDFDFFFNKKSEWHPELDALSASSRDKLRQVLFKMLREAELLTAEHKILPPMLTPRFINAITPERRQDIYLFPVFDSELRGAA